MASQFIVGAVGLNPDTDGTTPGGSASGDEVQIQFDNDMALPDFMEAMARARDQIIDHYTREDGA